MKPVRTGKRIWTGMILKVDRFGNLITNFHIDEFGGFRTNRFALQVGSEVVTRLAGTFGDLQAGEVAAIVGSSGFIEVVVNRQSAAKRLGCEAGAPAELTVYS